MQTTTSISVQGCQPGDPAALAHAVHAEHASENRFANLRAGNASRRPRPQSSNQPNTVSNGSSFMQPYVGNPVPSADHEEQDIQDNIAAASHGLSMGIAPVRTYPLQPISVYRYPGFGSAEGPSPMHMSGHSAGFPPSYGLGTVPNHPLPPPPPPPRTAIQQSARRHASVPSPSPSPPPVSRRKGKQPAKKLAAKKTSTKKREAKKPVNKPAKRGRQPGSRNYEDNDLLQLADIVEEILPLGPNGWHVVHSRFNKWARTVGRPQRELKPLRTKWDSTVIMERPTGTAEVDEWMRRIWEVEEAIVGKSATRTVDDQPEESDYEMTSASVIEILSSDADHDSPSGRPAMVKQEKGIKVERGLQPAGASVTKAFRTNAAPIPSRTRSAVTSTLVSNLEAAFDPSVQAARDQARFTHTTQASLILSLQAELRDARTLLDTTRDKLAQESRRADRATDRLELFSLGVGKEDEALSTSFVDRLNASGALRGRKRPNSFIDDCTNPRPRPSPIRDGWSVLISPLHGQSSGRALSLTSKRLSTPFPLMPQPVASATAPSAHQLMRNATPGPSNVHIAASPPCPSAVPSSPLSECN